MFEPIENENELDLDKPQEAATEEILDDEISEIEIFDDEDSLDEVIEIDDDDLKFDEPAQEEVPTKEEADVVLSKHSLQGKHSLKYDSIFKGKKEDPISDDSIEVSGNYNESFEVDKSSHYWHESIDNENYIKQKRIKERVYDVLSEHTELNFQNNRRKPSKADFNNYYYLLKTHLQEESFTNIEIFNELAVYFSDNLFNMFKLLDNKWRNLVINELQDHIGKQAYSKEVMNRNIFEGTEVEFVSQNTTQTELLHITGVVIKTDYENSMYTVNSYEKIYEVNLESITKILNNTKFKYNLNRLNNIDFL